MDIYPSKTDKLLFEADSPIQKIKVFDKLNGLRYMTLNTVQQGGHLPGRPDRLLMPYFRLAFTSMLFVDEPVDFLFVGLGMGGMPSFLRAIMPDADIDVVEIDPGVVSTAREWFGFREDERLRVSVKDGREFIKGAREKYDIIFLDAYKDVSVPSHLTTLEFMHEVRAALKPGGVAVANLWGSVVNPLYDSCVKTIAEAFPKVYRFKSYTYNFIFVADAKDEELDRGQLLYRSKDLMKNIHLSYDMVDAVRRQFDREIGKDLPGELITD